jgi:hypothetical protein
MLEQQPDNKLAVRLENLMASYLEFHPVGQWGFPKVGQLVATTVELKAAQSVCATVG